MCVWDDEPKNVGGTGRHFTARLIPSSKPESKPGLPRGAKVSDRIFTGYVPIGSEGFDSLKALE